MFFRFVTILLDFHCLLGEIMTILWCEEVVLFLIFDKLYDNEFKGILSVETVLFFNLLFLNLYELENIIILIDNDPTDFEMNRSRLC